MDLNQLRDDVFQIIEAKGFHDIEHSQLEAMTFRQIAHLANEWGEARRIYLTLPARYNGDKQATLAELYEELADVIIVALDLAGIHQVDMKDVGIEKMAIGTMDSLWEEMAMKIGMLANTYRKTKVVDAGKLRRIIVLAAFIMRRCGGDPVAQVQAKNEKNAERPERYGVAA